MQDWEGDKTPPLQDTTPDPDSRWYPSEQETVILPPSSREVRETSMFIQSDCIISHGTASCTASFRFDNFNLDSNIAGFKWVEKFCFPGYGRG